MINRTLFALLIILIACSCNQQTQRDVEEVKSIANQQLQSRCGLLIENKINRGINYTDPQGIDYSIRYIPITITNDSTMSIHVKLAFSKEYNYPQPYSDEKFRLIPLPKEWALDGVEISKGLINELPNYIENPILDEIIEPQEKIVLAIGSIYPRPAKSSGVLPRLLFVQSDNGVFSECERSIEKDQSSKLQIPIGLKIIFGEKCEIISCGQISYIEG